MSVYSMLSLAFGRNLTTCITLQSRAYLSYDFRQRHQYLYIFWFMFRGICNILCLCWSFAPCSPIVMMIVMPWYTLLLIIHIVDDVDNVVVTLFYYFMAIQIRYAKKQCAIKNCHLSTN